MGDHGHPQTFLLFERECRIDKGVNHQLHGVLVLDDGLHGSIIVQQQHHLVTIVGIDNAFGRYIQAQVVEAQLRMELGIVFTTSPAPVFNNSIVG